MCLDSAYDVFRFGIRLVRFFGVCFIWDYHILQLIHYFQFTVSAAYLQLGLWFRFSDVKLLYRYCVFKMLLV
jgi:hypothetical protein